MNSNVYLTDIGKREVIAFSDAGADIMRWGGYGSGAGQFFEPYAIDVSVNGKVYVADTGNRRVQIFDLNGNFITSFGNYGSGDGQFDYPMGIAAGKCADCESTYTTTYTHTRTPVYTLTRTMTSTLMATVTYTETITATKTWTFTNSHTITPTITFTPTSTDTIGACVYPDMQFGVGGIVTHHNAAGGNSHDYGNDAVINSAGEIFVCGHSYRYGNAYMTVWKFNDYGILDTAFGGTGYVIRDPSVNPSPRDSGRAIKIDQAGRLVVAGSGYNEYGNYRMSVWRHNQDGTVDLSFGTNGYVQSQGETSDNGHGVDIDGLGRILVVGEKVTYGVNNLVVWRYNPDGTIDTTFASGGIINDNISGYSVGYDVLLDSNNKIVVVGGSSSGLTVWRYNQDGSPDISFNGSGISSCCVNAAGRSVAFDSYGRIVVAGEDANANKMIIARFNPDGTLDSSFNSTGSFEFAADGKAAAYDIALDACGRIIAAGIIGADAALWRITESGMLDTVFNNGQGYLIKDINNGFDQANSVIVDSNRKIVVVGSAYIEGNANDMFMMRYIDDCDEGCNGSVPSIDLNMLASRVGELSTPEREIGLYTFPNPAFEVVNIKYNLREQSDVVLIIADINNGLVWKKSINMNETKRGTNTIVWDAKNERGIKVSNGIYILTAQLSGKIIRKKIAIIK